MTRFVTAANEVAANSPAQSIGILADLDFTSGIQRYTTRVHPVVFGGNTYEPIGYPVLIEDVREDTELRPQGVALTLSGTDASALSLALIDDYHGRTANLYIAWFDEHDQLIGTPEGPVPLIMSHAIVRLGEGNPVSLQCEDQWSLWNRAKPLGYTHETQLRFWSGDVGFQWGPFQKDKRLTWGARAVSTGLGGSPAPGRDFRPPARP